MFPIGFIGRTTRWQRMCFPPYQRLHWGHQRPYMGSKLTWVTIPFHSFRFCTVLRGSPTEGLFPFHFPLMLLPLSIIWLYTQDISPIEGFFTRFFLFIGCFVIFILISLWHYFSFSFPAFIL